MDGIERREDETINYGTEGRDQIDGNGDIFRKWFQEGSKRGPGGFQEGSTVDRGIVIIPY